MGRNPTQDHRNQTDSTPLRGFLAALGLATNRFESVRTILTGFEPTVEQGFFILPAESVQPDQPP